MWQVIEMCNGDVTEPLIIPDIISNWNDKLSQEFRAMVALEKQADRHGDMAQAIQLTAKFHYQLAHTGNNQVLADFIEQLCYRSSLVIAAYGTRESVNCDCGDHASLIDLLDKGLVNESQHWMRHHLEHIKESISLSGKQEAHVDFGKLFA